MWSRSTQSSGYVAEIISGDREGASLSVASVFRVGTSTDADVRLLSDLDGGAVFDIGSRKWTVTFDSPGAIDGRECPPGGTFRFRPGAVVTVAGVDLRVTPADVAASPLSSPFVAPAAICATGVALLLVAGGVSFESIAVGPAPTVSRDAIDFSSEFSAPLAAQLLERDLIAFGASRLSVSVDGDAVLVRGVVEPQDREAWARAREAFDAAYGDKVPMKLDLRDAPETVTLPFEIKSVWMSPAPLVVLGDGSRRRVGDTLPGGWTLSSVQAERIAIERGEQRLEFAY